MLNKIILKLITHQSDTQVQAMTTDALEDPASYKGWIYPLRYLLALRYLKIKQQVLKNFRSQKIYPIPQDEYKRTLIKQLSNKVKANPIDTPITNPVSALGFKSKIVYPIVLATLAVGLFSLNQWYQQRKIERIFANDLPYFSDLLHKKLIFTHNNQEKALTKMNALIQQEEEKILSSLPKKNGIRDVVEQQLLKLKDSTSSSEEIMFGFKEVNTVFDKHNLPFYLSPKSFSMPCSSLIDASVEEMIMLKELESLISNNNPELCRTTMMTAYKVDERKQLFYHADNKNTVELPLFRVKRIDKVPAIDSALGLTFKDRGIGSIILLERITNFAKESVLPALTFQGRNYIIPYWMQGYYEIEEAISKAYKKDLNKIYPDQKDQKNIKISVKSLINDKLRMSNAKMQQTLQRENTNSAKNIFGNGFDAISVLLGKSSNKGRHQKRKVLSKEFDPKILERLDDVLLPSIEYHEAYHQIDKKDWKSPAWLKTTFKDEQLDEQRIDHTLEELGAYLAQLANTDQGQNIWLSKLLIFSLNPMTKGQAEYYASSIIFNTMSSLDLGYKVNPDYKASVEEKTTIFKALTSKNQSEIKALAKAAYEALFDRPVPSLREKE
ncbi:MAG: hypothetical protein CR955_01190 [Thiotrichales bacterium]|nr:MAG: hypothetical protein CR955_01190 [Thiotrichales bacterium]